MVDYIADYLEDVGKRRVIPEIKPGYMRPLLPNEAPRTPEKWADIMSDVESKIMPGITHWQHPRFHAYFPAGASYPSILGDMLSDAIGCVGFSWAASPACTELETIVLDWLAKMIGLPSVFYHEDGIGGGVIQGSASDCVLVSVLAARHAALRDLKNLYPNENEGALLSRLVAYCSKLAHSCVEKAGMISLVKMRELDADEEFSLRGETLKKAIEEDRKMGLHPFYVCGTLGTTAVCSFDNLNEIGQICEEENLWLHVDAAYAGSALICPEFRHLLKGIERVNSFNMNPSKWMLVNFDCSAMWVRDRKILTNALTVDPLYLQHSHSDKAVDFRHWGIPLSRRFRSLKLWFVIRTYGVEGLQSYIREHCRLAKKFESLVKNDDRFETKGKVTMGLVCFRLKGHNVRTQNLLRAINMSGKLYMVPAIVNDDYVIRFAICAPNACDDDVTNAWTIISDTEKDVAVARLYSGIEEESEEAMIEARMSEPADSKFPELYPGDEEEEDEDELFLFDNNIPSVPSVIPDLPDVTPSEYPRRRNKLLRMISDPKCYNTKLLRRSLSHEEDRVVSPRASQSDRKSGLQNGICNGLDKSH